MSADLVTLPRSLALLVAFGCLAGCGGSDTPAGKDGGSPDGSTNSGPDSSLGTDAGGCTAMTRRCSGAGVETCGETGQWASPWACATGTCSGEDCTGSTTGGSNASCEVGDAGGIFTCGGSCCTSQELPGGTYSRTYVNSGSGPTGESDPATVTGFRLDEYLVTVGRFRQFVNAWNGGAGYLPPAGSGKHTHLNGGNGLTATGGGYESGWVASDDSNVAPTDANLNSTSCSPDATWTSSAGSNESLPIGCVNWWESYAFCIWDGGFLPSEAEWEYAAAGGSQEREYPWGTMDPGTQNQYAIYNCDYPVNIGGCTATSTAAFAPVGTAVLGAGRWGQLDLAGEVYEWTLDWYGGYVDPCIDCAYLTGGSTRVIRGGNVGDSTTNLLPPSRTDVPPTERYAGIGFRCARTP